MAEWRQLGRTFGFVIVGQGKNPDGWWDEHSSGPNDKAGGFGRPLPISI